MLAGARVGFVSVLPPSPSPYDVAWRFIVEPRKLLKRTESDRDAPALRAELIGSGELPSPVAPSPTSSGSLTGLPTVDESAGGAAVAAPPAGLSSKWGIKTSRTVFRVALTAVIAGLRAVPAL